MTSLTPDTARRLALIRLLLQRAERDVSQPPPFSFDAVNRLHDVAEMFLAAAAQHNSVGIPKEFDKYWDNLSVPLGRPLLYQASMQRYNKLRVGLKHYGNEPAQREIAAMAITVRGLIEDEMPHLFGVELNQIFLTHFVTCEAARRLLGEAQDAWQESKWGALGRVAAAFDELVRDYEARRLTGVFNIEIRDTSHLSIRENKALGVTLRTFSRAVDQALQDMSELTKLVALQIDVHRYRKFRSLTPGVHRSVNGTYTFDIVGGRPEPSQDDFDFCWDFVISTAINLASIDSDLDTPTMRIN